MNEILKVDFDNQTVSARELHKQLKIGTRFNGWHPRMTEYGFSEGNEFFPKMGETSESGGRPQTDYEISADMAKQIRILERAWNTPEQVMTRALKIADRQIEDDKPKTIFADTVSASHTSTLIEDLAKLICQDEQKRLFQWMRDNGYLMKSGVSYNMQMQRYVEQGLFEIEESNVQNPDGSVRITRTIKITGKGQLYFVNKFLGKEKANGKN